MSGFDDPGVFFSDNFNFNEDQENNNNNNNNNRQQAKNKFKEFIRQFHDHQFVYKYRDQLKRNANINKFKLDILLDDLSCYDNQIYEALNKSPNYNLPIFEEAAKEVAQELAKPEDEIKDIQICLTSKSNFYTFRELKSDHVSKLLKISGIIISTSSSKVKATSLTLQCRSCHNYIHNIPVNAGLEGYSLPRKCNSNQTGQVTCPVDPYFIVPNKSKCVDYQILKLQECPESVPNGELPRHLLLYLDRYLCDTVVPGNRVCILGVYCIKKVSSLGKRSSREKINVGVRMPYIRVVGIETTTSGLGRLSNNLKMAPNSESEFYDLARNSNIYEKISLNMAPSIYGSNDIKKAIACLLFGGSRKRLPDGLLRRGDINILLLGDPGTAKSQILKFVQTVAPIGVYTSGKGSSAAGLTASVVRDPSSRSFIMEGGAMVLADGGVVCIDEFDKMREDDRVAIHEAMEQQTISIAKAGITTTLNSRCSVLAAANSIYGKWDNDKGNHGNIDFMPTILSRFDMIFIVKDHHDQNRDTTIARHVINLHMNASQLNERMKPGEIPLEKLKNFITFCRNTCGPRLSSQASEKLKNKYILMRNGALQKEKDNHHNNPVPITVRQLEAIIRISESLAKMRLSPFVSESDVDEAIRLFQVSTLDAAMSGQLAGAEGFVTEEDQEMMNRIEKQLKRRFVVGCQVSEHAIVQDFVKQNYEERAIIKVIEMMVRREELQYRMQRKMLFRVQ